jgi:hypothetical protein
MKRLLLLSTLALGLAAGVQAQGTQLTITLNTATMPNSNCNLAGGVVPNNKVYIHSGICTSSDNDCTSGILCSGSTVWQTVIGNWGQDDGIGLMTSLGNGIFSINIILESYYNLQGATPYAMGLVFRSADGGVEGKDAQCSDIFIKGIQSTPAAVNCDNSPYGAINVTKTILAGLADPSYLGALTVSPNPSVDQVRIAYALRKPAQALSAQILDAQGRLVADLFQGRQTPGAQQLTWDGSQAAAGLYTFVLRESGRVLATERIMIAK